MRISDWSSDVCSSDLSSPAAVVSGPCGPPVVSGPCGPPVVSGPCGPPVVSGPCGPPVVSGSCGPAALHSTGGALRPSPRSEEHTSELQSLMRISYAVFCLKKKKKTYTQVTQLK